MKNGTITADEILEQKPKRLSHDDETKFLHSMRPNSPQVGDQPTVVLKVGTSSLLRGDCLHLSMLGFYHRAATKLDKKTKNVEDSRGDHGWCWFGSGNRWNGYQASRG